MTSETEFLTQIHDALESTAHNAMKRAELREMIAERVRSLSTGPVPYKLMQECADALAAQVERHPDPAGHALRLVNRIDKECKE